MKENLQNEKIRINKYLASCGVCSRREADRMISDGKILVNGKIADMGILVSDEDEIFADGKKVVRDEKVVLAYYKPTGVICSEKDDHAEKLLFDVFKYPVRLTYAGRLDKDSEGLMILTNDGDLIDALMKGKNAHEKEYEVRINKEVTQDFIDKMSSGIYLPEVNITTRPCKVEKMGRNSFRIVLTQGVNRQIRRMCKEQNCYVTHLKRVRIANILLANLKIGEYRKISGIELQSLYNIAYNEK